MEHLLLNHSETIHIFLETLIALGTVGTLLVMLIAFIKDKSKLSASLYATNDCGMLEEEKVLLKIINKTSNDYTVSKDYAFGIRTPLLKITASLPLCPIGVDYQTLVGEYNFVLPPLNTTLMELGNIEEFCLDALEVFQVNNIFRAVLLLSLMSFSLKTLSDDKIKVSVSLRLRLKSILKWKELQNSKTEETIVNV